MAALRHRQSYVVTTYPNAEKHTIAAAHRLVEAMTWQAQERRKRPLERRLAVLVRRMFARQAAAIATKFMPRVRKAALLREAAELPADLGNLLDAVLATDANNWARQLLDVLGDAWLAGAGDLKGDISPSFDMPIDRPRDILADRAGDRITRIDDVTRQAVRDILVSGMEQRKTYQQVARELRQKFREFRTPARQRHIRDRAELIAITEVGQAYVDGQLAVAARLQSRGIAMEKSWLTVGDGRVSDGCRDNAAAGWIELSSAFPSGHPAPLRFPGCRCALQMRQRGVE